MDKNLPMSSALQLADGSSWNISAEDAISSKIAKVLTRTMQLRSSNLNGQRLVTLKNGHPENTSQTSISFSPGLYSAKDKNHPIICRVSDPSNNDELAFQLMKLSLVFCTHKCSSFPD